MFGIGGKVETVIGEGAQFSGQIDIQGGIFINGKVLGNVLCDGLITLGEKADVRGDLRAPRIVIGGRLEGKIRATELVELLSSAKVSGDIHTPKLSIAEGAMFEGNCEMTPAGATVEFKAASRK